MANRSKFRDSQRDQLNFKENNNTREVDFRQNDTEMKEDTSKKLLKNFKLG